MVYEATYSSAASLRATRSERLNPAFAKPRASILSGRLSSLPVSGAFQPRGHTAATGKSPEPAGWKACPTS